MRFCILIGLLCLCAPLFSQAVADTSVDQVSGPDGRFRVLRIFPMHYWLDSEQQSNVRALTEASGPGDPLVIVLWGPYTPRVLDANAERSRIFPQHFEWFLHRLCYKDVNYEDPAYRKHQMAESRCYAERTVEFLRGRTLPYFMFAMWGDNLESYEYIGLIRYPVILLTMVVFSIPQLFLFLLILLPFQSWLSSREFVQRVFKVVLPMIIGIAWLFFFMERVGDEWYITPFRFVLPMSGVYFALTFISCMWIADYVYFRQNNPPSPWVVAFFYVFAPIMILGAGAAARGSRGTYVSSRGSSSGASGGSGSTGGGGSFGGGGASASF